MWILPIRPSPIWSSRVSWKKPWNLWKQRLGRKAKREALAALGKVRQLLAEGNTDRAAETLKRQLTATGLQFGFHVFQLKAGCQNFGRSGQLAAAESIIRRMLEISHRPEDVLMLISNVARQGRIDEALNLCQKAWKNCPPESVGGVCVGVVRTGNVSKSQMELANPNCWRRSTRIPSP